MPCRSSLTLEELGTVLLHALRVWLAQAGADAAETIAHCVIRFTAQILTEDAPSRDALN